MTTEHHLTAWEEATGLELKGWKDKDWPITDRPPVRRPTTTEPWKQGDPIARAVLTAWLTIAIIALTAAVTRGTYTPHVILGCIAAGIATAAAGWAAYAIQERGQ